MALMESAGLPLRMTLVSLFTMSRTSKSLAMRAAPKSSVPKNVTSRSRPAGVGGSGEGGFFEFDSMMEVTTQVGSQAVSHVGGAGSQFRHDRLGCGTELPLQ